MDITKRTLLVTLALILVCICQSLADSFPGCSAGKYYNHDSESCVPCSTCTGQNQVAFRQCYGDRDTLCGTFGKKFEFRQAGPSTDDQDKALTDQLPSTPTSELTDATVLYANDNKERKWFTITVVLVTVFVLVCVAVIVVLFAVCLMCRKKQREIICDSVLRTDLLKDSIANSPRTTGHTIEQFTLITET